MNVAKETTYRDADGNLTTDKEKGLFLVAAEGAEITPDIAKNFPELKGTESKGDAGDNTLSEAEKAEVEANASAANARRNRDHGHGEGLGDPAELAEKARKAAMKAQGELAASIGKPGTGEDVSAVEGPKGKRAQGGAENK